MMTKNFSVGQDKIHGISIVCDPNLPCKALFQFGSYAKNGPKSKSFYLFAKLNAAQFDWLILANQIQATWSGMPINCSSRKNISRVT